MSTAPRLRDWLGLNLNIGALSFGGSARMMLFQEAVVDQRQWLTLEEFQEILTMSTVFPGPNLVNLAVYLGLRLVGPLGAALGAFVLALPGALLLATVVLLLPLDNRHVLLIFQGFALGSVALFGIFLERYYQSLRKSAFAGKTLRQVKFGLRLMAALLIAIASWWHVPLVEIILFGGAGCLVLEFLT